MERWRFVVGYEGLYSVSDLGRVRSEPRVTETRSGPREYLGRVLRLTPDRKGYLYFTACREGKTKHVHVAVAVMRAFKGAPPKGRQCCHNNGRKTDNRKSNLRYDTPQNNHADKVHHGTTNRGERSATAKLTVAIVKQVRRDARRQADIAADVGVSQTMISRIKLRKAWAHI